MPIPRQLTLILEPMALTEAVAKSSVSYGVVFTRRWVVELILDLVGYTPDRDLASMLLVEPSCGSGAFLGPIVERLIESAARHERDLDEIGDAVRAFDLLSDNAELARKAVTSALQDAGLARVTADRASCKMVTTGDFLLHPHQSRCADFVVGNPPYIRLEDVSREVMDEYRRACPTMRGRSDVYVGFIERGLDLLRPQGVLGFICADRWMRNQYGAGLRDLVSSSYAVETVITMHDADAFEDEVSAYPAVIVLKNDAQGPANVVDANGAFGEPAAKLVAAWARGTRRAMTSKTFEASRLQRWFDGSDLWPTGSPQLLAAVADLEARFPPLQDRSTGTRVGIGIATGCDDVYITDDIAPIERERLLPLLQAGDTTTGRVEWSGRYLANPWDEDGLVELRDYPRLKKYFNANGDDLKRRHIATKRPAQWYRTIDRVDPTLLARPKLVLPDLKASAHPVLDEGNFYPHHNLYYVVSDGWDLEVLGGLLLSDVANLFVGAYCVRMRGGCYRFQAQYLRRIRVPALSSVSKPDAKALARAFDSRDVDAATAVAARLYGLAEFPPLR